MSTINTYTSDKTSKQNYTLPLTEGRRIPFFVSSNWLVFESAVYTDWAQASSNYMYALK